MAKVLSTTEEVLEEWKSLSSAEDRGFVKDGIINEELYWNARKRILFLNKEPYWVKDPTEHWDLREWIREDDWRSRSTRGTWPCLERAAFGIMEAKDGRAPSFPSTRTDCLNYFQMTAVANIKKTNGEKASNDADLVEHLKDRIHLLKIQIELVNPEIIICGNTFCVIRKLLPESSVTKLSEMVYDVDGRCYVDFWHPANRYPNKMNYYTLMSVLQLAHLL